MSTTTSAALQKYRDKLKVFRAFNSAQSLLSWDRETFMPKKASSDRGETMALLAGFSHVLFTAPEFVQVVTTLHEHQEKLNPIEKRSVSLTKKELDKASKLSKEFVEETNVIVNAAYSAWLEAKKTDNFALFAPHLKAVVENRRHYAELIDSSRDPYDVLLDDYEEGLTRDQLQPLFTQLREGLVKILPQILEKQQPVSNPLDQHPFEKYKLEEFLSEMVKTIGFDLDRGVLGSVEHPFELAVSFHDVRLNTHYDPLGASFSITGMVHELGHGLYEQNIREQYAELGLDHGVSLGIHESQSRFLENMIGRSRAFWSYFLPKFQASFPQLRGVSLDQVLSGLNQVQPSLIRTEADEVTYNLHVILRFELEQELMEKKLSVKELPEAWQAKMKELVGVAPTTDKDGVLQDVHWAWGNLGYFPTYTLGNMNAAQFFFSFNKAHPHWQDEIEKGEFRSYFSWFKEHVWQHGSFYTPAEVMKKATGEDTQAQYLLEYLRAKYLG